MYNAYTLESRASSLSQKGYIFRVYGLTKYKMKKKTHKILKRNLFHEYKFLNKCPCALDDLKIACCFPVRTVILKAVYFMYNHI